jgi:hypothetical protein
MHMLRLLCTLFLFQGDVYINSKMCDYVDHIYPIKFEIDDIAGELDLIDTWG